MEQYYTKEIDIIKQKAIIDDAVDLVFMNKDREHVHKIISSLTESLAGGFNAWRDMDTYLDYEFVNKYWQEAQRIVFDSGNQGWTMCFKEMLQIMSERIKSLENE